MPNSKRAVVTGGANGIGQAFRKRLAAQGAKVAVADIANSGETVGAIKNKGGSAFAVHCDPTRSSERPGFADRLRVADHFLPPTFQFGGIAA
jgi:NAD(P)-dependent dehydrogenase (short-subunit alcohol dehydrogenase family)